MVVTIDVKIIEPNSSEEIQPFSISKTAKKLRLGQKCFRLSKVRTISVKITHSGNILR